MEVKARQMNSFSVNLNNVIMTKYVIFVNLIKLLPITLIHYLFSKVKKTLSYENKAIGSKFVDLE
jgi:hypothetical protein